MPEIENGGSTPPAHDKPLAGLFERPASNQKEGDSGRLRSCDKPLYHLQWLQSNRCMVQRGYGVPCQMQNKSLDWNKKLAAQNSIAGAWKLSFTNSLQGAGLYRPASNLKEGKWK